MQGQLFETDDQEIKVPNPDDQINMELTEEDQAVDVDIESNEETGEVQAQIKEKGDDGKEHEEYSARVKKRLDKMTAKLREAERREQAAIQYAEQVQKTLSETQKRAQSLDQGYLSETENRVNSQLSIVEANLQDAVERGDGKAVVEAQKLLSQLILQQEKIKTAKTAPKKQEQTYELPQELRRPKAPDPKAEEWAEQNTWFGEDVAMTNAAYGIHNQLAAEQFDLSSDEYYDELNRRIRKAFPHKFKPQADISNVPNVAPATRSVSSASGRKTVKLTPSEVSVARRLGVPLDEYAKYVRR